MKITLGRQIEEIKKKDSENEKNLLKNRNSDELNEVDADDIYFHSNTIKNIKLGTNVVKRIYLNNSIVYELQDTIDLNLFHSLVPAATATSIIFDKLENQDITSYNLAGYCDVNNHIAVYNNNTEYLVLNIRNAVNYAPIISSSFFYSYRYLISCVFSNFNTQNVTNMQSMFYYCQQLTSIDLSHFNTENLSGSLFGMFSNCKNLTSLDLTNFNIKNVTSIGSFMESCNNLTSLDLSHFNTKEITSFYRCFLNCFQLKSLKLGSWNTHRTTNMYQMFFSCRSLVSIISDTFDTSSLSTSDGMFTGCSSLVGGNGTVFNSSHTNAEYARVDGENGLPGYFTAPANK